MEFENVVLLRFCWKWSMVWSWCDAREFTYLFAEKYQAYSFLNFLLTRCINWVIRRRILTICWPCISVYLS